jgi:hypothetical protein
MYEPTGLQASALPKGNDDLKLGFAARPLHRRVRRDYNEERLPRSEARAPLTLRPNEDAIFASNPTTGTKSVTSYCITPSQKSSLETPAI